MKLLEGKKVLIVGVASARSIASGIAQSMHRAGAMLAFTYQDERLKSRVKQLASQLDSDYIYPCDVTDDQQINAVFEQLGAAWNGLDILVHSVAFAEKAQLTGGYLEHLTRSSFLTAHEISSYSFAALGNAARPLMQGRDAAMLTLSYIGAVRAIPNYNIMGVAKASLEASVRYMAADLGPLGVRVNAISAGPIRTLAASGIKGFKSFLHQAQRASPPRRNVTIEEVGNAATFLCSDYASAITGEVTYVDCGYNVVGIGAAHDVDDAAEK